MNTRLKNRILFSLCVSRLQGIHNNFKKGTSKPTKEAAAAWLAICESLMGMACGAAIRSDIGKESTDPLVALMDDLWLYLEGNTHGNGKI